MKRDLLEFLVCYECFSPLEPIVFEEKLFKSKEIIDGLLQCKRCGLTIPIIEGIPRFVPNILSSYTDFLKRYPQVSKLSKTFTNRRGPEDAQSSDFLKMHGTTQKRFGFEWMHYPGPLPEDKKIFLSETQIASEEWQGKRVLDAGCGMGRYSRIAHELGATVVALDLSGALIRLWDLAKESERLHLVQGNLLSLPFKEKAFDIVYSIGVIHHTPSAQTAFKRCSQLVRPGGRLTVWVYGTAGNFENFKSNPLRTDRDHLKKYLFIVWLIVRMRETVSNVLRLITVRLPHQFLYGLCALLAMIGNFPLLKYLTFSVHPFWRVRLQENFDWLSPPYQSHHTKEEMVQWFEENGFEVLKVLPHGFVPKPGILGRKK